MYSSPRRREIPSVVLIAVTCILMVKNRQLSFFSEFVAKVHGIKWPNLIKSFERVILPFICGTGLGLGGSFLSHGWAGRAPGRPNGKAWHGILPYIRSSEG